MTTLLWGGVMIHSRSGFDLVVDRLISCSRLLLACSVNSLIGVLLNVGSCTLHSKHLSLSDGVSLMR